MERSNLQTEIKLTLKKQPFKGHFRVGPFLMAGKIVFNDKMVYLTNKSS